MPPTAACAEVLRGLCLAGALTAGATPLAACDPVWLSTARPEGISVFVALALADTVADTDATPIRPRLHPLFGSALDEHGGRTPGGQRVRMLQWPAASSAPETREAVVVPWSYQPNCRPAAWNGPLRWIPAGTTGAMTGWLRPREHWLGGLPTFDVEMAWREPVWTEGEPRWTASTNDTLMTPAEFLQLYAALPTAENLELRPAETAARLRIWDREHPGLAARVPAKVLLSNLHRETAERTARGSGPSLSGRWIVEVELIDASQLPLPIARKTISGELRLSVVRPAGDDTDDLGVYSGSSTLDFTPLGFRLGSTEVTAAVTGDSVRLILDPTVDHGHVAAMLAGTNDELAGTWYLNSRPARASGRIRLRRTALPSLPTEP